eukprot:m.137325 g.137325  ORF g.137325 m.137325 type:complete len:508 (+) comp11546_c0_seq1:70-1593(+)
MNTETASSSTPLINAVGEKQSKDKLTKWVILAVFIAVLGGTFQFGYHTGVLGSPEEAIKLSLSGCEKWRTCEKNITTVQWSTAVSMFAIGGCVGGLGSGPVVSLLGLRWAFAINNVIFIAASLMMAFSTHIELFTAGRFVVGIGSGVTTAITGKYLADIAPISLRGGISIVAQLGCTFGILVAQVMGMGQALGTHKKWPYLLGFSIIPALIQLLVIFILPESPRWLYLNKRDTIGARKALMKLRDFDENVVNRDIAEMEDEKEKQASVTTLSILELFKDSLLTRVVLIGVMLQACQQLSGINAIFYFSGSIFKSAHVKDSDIATVIAGTINVLMTVVSVFLIDRLGRRALLLWGIAGMTVFYSLLTISLHTQDSAAGMSYVSVLSVVMVIVFFAVGPGGIPWLMVAELFSTAASPAAISICVGCNWMFNFVVGITFPSIQSALKDNSFIPFIGITIIAFFAIYVFAPETKGKTVQEIEFEIQKKKTNRSGAVYEIMPSNDDNTNSLP